MIEPVYLFYCADVPLGGFVSYTVHLYRSMEAMGMQPVLVKLGKSTDRKTRHWREGVHTIRMSVRDAVQTALSSPSLIVCVQWKKMKAFARPLLDVGVPWVTHDASPGEWDKELLDAGRRNNSKIVAIRSTLEEKLRPTGLNVRFIHHPYRRKFDDSGYAADKGACTLSRVDWDKHTEMVCEANLKHDAKIDIWGFENRLFSHHKLDKDWPGWRRRFRGKFASGTGATMARHHAYAVDMTDIKRDGGGTQYTHLEAWDAGTVLVLNKAWWRDGAGDVLEGVHAVAAATPAGLAGVVRGSPVGHRHTVDAGRAMLAAHTPQAVVPAYREFLRW